MFILMVLALNVVPAVDVDSDQTVDEGDTRNETGTGGIIGKSSVRYLFSTSVS